MKRIAEAFVSLAKAVYWTFYGADSRSEVRYQK
jgi:hypothetical protein